MQTTIAASALEMECIDGADSQCSFKLVNNETLILSSIEGEGRRMISELQQSGGAVIITNINGRIFVDASDCAVPVKINGEIISKKHLLPSDILRIGNSTWRQVNNNNGQEALKSNPQSINYHFTNLIGLEELRDFKLRDIFSQVFKKHSLVQMEDQLITGTSSHTPALSEIETGWARPWLFSRMLLVSVAITIIMIIGYRTFENPNLLPGLMFIGSFAVPVSTLIFFLEMNAPRNISIFMVMALAFLGGVTSLFVALIFFDRFEFLSDLMSASAAGIIEEIAKILVVVLIVGRLTRYKWVLNGLLFGAAIGMGFAAFESAGYAYRAVSFDSMVDSIVLRGLLSPFMHIVWTANAAAALWLVKGDKPLNWNMLADPKFLRVMISSMLLHMTWNANFHLLEIPVFYDIKYLLLGIIAWVICFRLVQVGLKQLNEARVM
jgi:RsiW-degrading membrane proteinase PrsW (M82 family)